MPYRSKKPCQHPNCLELIELGKTYCKKHQCLAYKKDIERRGTATQRGYNYRWRVASKLYLKKNPLCVYCKRENYSKRI